MQNKNKYLIAVLIPLIVLLSMTILPLQTLLWGQEILLKTEPYDPKDLFRGDYVVLNYQINSLELSKFPVELRNEQNSYKYQGKDLYAVLKKVDNCYDVDYVLLEKPKDELFLKCKFLYISKDFNTDQQVAYVNYNLDKYFISENTGVKLESLAQKGQLLAKVKVYHGYALLTDVLCK